MKFYYFFCIVLKYEISAQPVVDSFQLVMGMCGFPAMKDVKIYKEDQLLNGTIPIIESSSLYTFQDYMYAFKAWL